MAGVNKYKDGVVSRLFKGLTGLIKGRGITVIEGEGRLTGPREVTVDGTRLHRPRTSSSPPAPTRKSLPGLEVDGERVLTSEHALRLDRVPAVRRSCSAAASSAASSPASGARFGAEVTIVEALPRLVAAEDEAVSKALERAFRKRRIAFRTGTPFQSVETTDDGVAVHRRGRRRRSRPSCCSSRSAAARHRRPRLRRAGRGDGARLRLTDERCRTNLEGVYAVGDIVPGLQLAHRGFQQGIFVAEDIAGLDPGADRRVRHPAGHLLRPRGRLGRPQRGGARRASRRRRGRVADLRPRRQRQEPDPRHPGLRQAGPAQGRPGRRCAHGRRPGRRADRRGAADLRLGGARPRTSPRWSTPTRPRTKPSARPTSPSPGSRCTPTPDPRQPTQTRLRSEGIHGHRSHPPGTRRVRHRRHRHPLAEAGRRQGRGRRAAAGGLHRQGRHRDPLPRGRHPARDQGERGRHGRGRRRARDDRRRGRVVRRLGRVRRVRWPGRRSRSRAGRRRAGRAPVAARTSSRSRPSSRPRSRTAGGEAPSEQEPAAEQRAGVGVRRGRWRWRYVGDAARAGRVGHRGHRHPLAQAGRRRGRGRRAAARGLHRQGRHRDPLAGRRHAPGDQGRGGRDRRGRRRAGDHRLRRRGAPAQAEPEAQPADEEQAGAGAEQQEAEPPSEKRPSPSPSPRPRSSPSRSRRPSRSPPRGGAGAGAREATAPSASTYVTPLVRKMAAQHGVDLASVTGTGVGGRIRKQDVLDAAAKAKEAPAEQPAGRARPPRRSSRQRRPGRRARCAARPSRSPGCARSSPSGWSSRCRSSAQLTQVVEVDVTNDRPAARRGRRRTSLAREGVKLSYLPFFAKAAIDALKQHPSLNATIDTEAGEVTYYDRENLAFAVDTEKGLLTPVVKDAGDLSIAGLAKKIADVAERTRTNKIGPDELVGRHLHDHQPRQRGRPLRHPDHQPAAGRDPRHRARS